jgi:hypothetical protein
MKPILKPPRLAECGFCLYPCHLVDAGKYSAPNPVKNSHPCMCPSCEEFKARKSDSPGGFGRG